MPVIVEDVAQTALCEEKGFVLVRKKNSSSTMQIQLQTDNDDGNALSSEIVRSPDDSARRNVGFVVLKL